MSLAVERDLGEIRAGVERWLGRPVGELTRPDPGFSCETVIVERELVLRLPPAAEGIFPGYDLARQAAAMQAAGAAGVPVPAPARHEPDPSYLGTPFLAMPFVEGPIPSNFTPADPWLTGLPDDAARHGVWAAFLDTVLDVHGAAHHGLGLRTGLDAELAHWEHYVDWATDGDPPAGLVDALSWCRAHRPAAEPPAGMLWGDVRLGNVVFDPATARPRAVLDWDMVSAGPAELDLAWFTALEAVQAELSGMTVPGFGDRAATVARAEARLGRAVVALDWYETFALVRASAVSTRIAVLFERAGRRTMFAVGDDPTIAAALRRIG